MTTLLETPSRIWRRIEAIEHRDMPSLPSLPLFEDSVDPEDESQLRGDDEGDIGNGGDASSPVHSTPTVTSSHRGSTTTISNSSTTRFGRSITSRSTRSSSGITRKKKSLDSFEVPSLPVIHPTTIDRDSEEEGIESLSSVPDVYLPPDCDDEQQEVDTGYPLEDALASISGEESPPFPPEVTPDRNHFDSESKPSPLEKYRYVALRRTNPRVRTPSLTRTSSSGSSSLSHATPRSNNSLEELNEALRNAEEESLLENDLSHETHETRSMDITDVHDSPPRADTESDVAFEDVELRSEEAKSQSAQDHEPTFSSEGDATPYVKERRVSTTNTDRSHSPSIAFTPTPALPRPRARFSLPSPPSDLLSTPVPGSRNTGVSDQTPRRDVIPATPYNRPSFLLSVINSTTRPRLTAGTPHPKMFGTPSMAESTPAANNGSSSNSASAVNVRNAFATINRRPRTALAPRLSHPLSQVTSTQISDPVSEDEAPWMTTSPYDGNTDKASFISTASSHDLTTHPRVNTSFDPAMGFGPGGVGRFNANKLNTYLHGLNRRLQEENEVLVERLKELEEEKKVRVNSTLEVESSSRKVSDPTRRRSSIGTVLGDVEEDKAEEWLEEKAELEGVIDVLKTEVRVYGTRKEELERQLETEKDEREREKARWKERMLEAQAGASELLVTLETKATAAEERTKKIEKEANRKVKEMESALAEMGGQRDIATGRALKAEKLLEGEKDFGVPLAEANGRIARVMGDLKNAELQIKGLEDEVLFSESQIRELEKEVKNQRNVIVGLETAAETRENVIAEDGAKIKKLEDTIDGLDEKLYKAESSVQALELGAEDDSNRIHQLEEELGLAHEIIKKLNTLEQQNSKDIKALEQQVGAALVRENQMEEAVDVAEGKVLKEEEVILELRNRVASLERERQKDDSVSSRGPDSVVYSAADYEALEKELEEADKEKARLRTLLDQSPARKAIEKAKELKIELLEREKEELLERNRALRMTVNEITPNKLINASGISPIHRHVLNVSMRMPRTPGTPLRDLSWLNSTQHDPSLTPLVGEIQRLQGELDRANISIDDKLDKLENAGIDVVSMAQKLEEARTKIITLEDEIADLKRKEDRRTRRLARARCRKCHIKLDLENLLQPDESSTSLTKDDLATEPPTPPTRTSEALKANLRVVNDNLDELKKKWETEKSRLMGEKAVLQDAANRLNVEIKTTKSDTKKASQNTKAIIASKTNVQNELNKAKETIAVLEQELSTERSRLRSMVIDQERMQQEKKRIMANMHRNESDIDEVKQQTEKLKRENQKLEKELRENATVEQKARLLETRVVENVNTIEQLRQERSILVNEHKDLQRRFKDINEVANDLRNKCSSLSTVHDNRRHELDMHRLEMDELRKALEDRAIDLQKLERERAFEKDAVAQTVAGLEADLERVKHDAEAFGRDLKALKAEKEKLEVSSKDEIAKADRTKKEAQAQIRVLNEQLNAEKDKANKAAELLENQNFDRDDRQLSKLKVQHSKECKGLIVQIRYLKAKFTRESLFREDLTYQKRYLLVLLRQFEKSERNIFAAIARIGFPVAPPPVQLTKPKLKSIASALIFLSRIKKSSSAWSRECLAKKSVVAALEDVRKRRTTNSD